MIKSKAILPAEQEILDAIEHAVSGNDQNATITLF